jgi:predicted alpha/beta-hydrolase family hydrolase
MHSAGPTRTSCDLAVPTLVVHGTADEMIAVANGNYVAELIPKSG